jgi:hypothetical protein
VQIVWNQTIVMIALGYLQIFHDHYSFNGLIVKLLNKCRKIHRTICSFDILAEDPLSRFVWLYLGL